MERKKYEYNTELMCWAFDNTLLSSMQDGGILLFHYYTFDIFAFKKKRT